MAGPQLSPNDRTIRDQRIVAAIEKGVAIKDVASRFGVSSAVVRKAIKENQPGTVRQLKG